MNDVHLEKKASAYETRALKKIKAVYREALQKVAETLRPVALGLSGFDVIPAPLNVPKNAAELWKEARKREALRKNTGELEKAAKTLANAGEKSRCITFDLLEKVHLWNAGKDIAFSSTHTTRTAFDGYNSKAECFRRVQEVFSPFVSAVVFIKAFAMRLAKLVSSMVGRIKNLLRTLVKRVQNFARLKWMKVQNKHLHPGERPWGKKWDPIVDDATRDSHLEMEGQVKPLNEPFITGAGNKIMFPGDTNAPIEEWINCRCNLRRVRID